MPRALKVCSCLKCDAHDGSCPDLTPTGRCESCTRQADRARGTAAQRGYGHRWAKVVRPRFLRANPFCVLCGALAEVPDHYPASRRELVEQGVSDPDAAQYLRPLCKRCHYSSTAIRQPGKFGSER